jgi:hypothetical protein
MSLPNSEKAYVPDQKLKAYLLSETHAIGRAKAKYFRGLGDTESNAEQLADALLAIVKSEEVREKVTTDYGTKYIVDGDILTPGGTVVRLRTVWVIEPHDDRPRFVTAYPV